MPRLKPVGSDDEFAYRPKAVSTTIRLLKKYHLWRHGLVDEWDDKNRVPPSHVLDSTVLSAIEHLKQYDKLRRS